MSRRKASLPQLDQADKLLDFHGVIEAMRYLGYTTHTDGGTIAEKARATAAALAGRVTVSVVLGSLIAEEYARQAG